MAGKRYNPAVSGLTTPPKLPNIKLGDKPRPQVKEQRQVAYFMVLAPEYTNSTAMQPVRETELVQARLLYPRGKFFKVETVTTTTKTQI